MINIFGHCTGFLQISVSFHAGVNFIDDMPSYRLLHKHSFNTSTYKHDVIVSSDTHLQMHIWKVHAVVVLLDLNFRIPAVDPRFYRFNWGQAPSNGEDLICLQM